MLIINMKAFAERTNSTTLSVFAEMTGLALAHQATNLGQGYPSNPPPLFAIEAGRAALGYANQYTAPQGLPILRETLAAEYSLRQNREVPPDHVVITCGATEALFATAMTLYAPGNEVVIIEPYFDIYLPHTQLTGAKAVMVPMQLSSAGWQLNVSALETACTDKTVALLVNNPHNPTGTILPAASLARIVELARDRDLWIIADEVYEELYFTTPPIPLAQLAPERTLSIGSLGKRLDATGWRVGWIVAPENPELVARLVAMRQWSSFCAPTPLQAAAAAALSKAQQNDFYYQLRTRYQARGTQLLEGLRMLGLEVFESGGTYFLTAIFPGLNAREMVEKAGVAVIPGAAFYAQHTAPPGLARLAFCKTANELDEALERISRYLQN